MSRLKDLPLGILIDLQDADPYILEGMVINQISGGLLLGGIK
jgi:hypothetical protein